MDEIYQCYNPDALALQCGVDTVADDPMQSFNLTPVAVSKCVRHVLDWSLPTLLVGGGETNFLVVKLVVFFVDAVNPLS